MLLTIRPPTKPVTRPLPSWRTRCAVVRRVADEGQLVVLLGRREHRSGRRVGRFRALGRATGARAEGARLLGHARRGREQEERLRPGIAVVELVGVARVGPADVAPGVRLGVDLDRPDHAGEVVVVDEDGELAPTLVLDGERRDRMPTRAVALEDRDRVQLTLRVVQRLHERAEDGCRRPDDATLLDGRQILERPVLGQQRLKRQIAPDRQLERGLRAVILCQSDAPVELDRRHGEAHAVTASHARVLVGHPLLRDRRQLAAGARPLRAHLASEEILDLPRRHVLRPDVVPVVLEAEAVDPGTEAVVCHDLPGRLVALHPSGRLGADEAGEARHAGWRRPDRAARVTARREQDEHGAGSAGEDEDTPHPRTRFLSTNKVLAGRSASRRIR